MRISGDKNLPALRDSACAAIDTAAELARRAHATPGDGMAMVYAAKVAEARAYVAAPVGDAAQWPLMAAEIGTTAPSLAGVAQAILARALAWTVAMAAIEHHRLARKAAVRASRSPDEIAEWRRAPFEVLPAGTA